ncbi:MAG: phosphatidylserine decarboxylase [Myxococcales bacterium]|nr:MAG: phosphatidylserine decarboxylase [Myxococcales bacterium]
MKERTTRIFLRMLPKRSLTGTVGWLSDRRPPRRVLHSTIRFFVRRYGVEIDEAAEPPEAFDSFDAFFTRALKPGARPIDAAPEAIVSPCDGTWAESGPLEALQLTQIKGKRYSAARLLGDERLAEAFDGGRFATVYLAPRDYHRVHFPVDGAIAGYRYIPGALYPVNPPAVRSIPNLFSRNERLVVRLTTSSGLVVVVMVGATCVARISASFERERGPFRHGRSAEASYDPPLAVRRGDELGMFHMGSTVVLLFPPGKMEFENVTPGAAVRMGERIGRW